VGERERVKKAIEAPVEAAGKLLDESPRGDVETRLAMLIDGWGRGLAAGLEELAIALADLRGESNDDGQAQTAPSRTEDQLRADAERSREETAALRDEASGDN
jgi:hypothetical protein